MLRNLGVERRGPARNDYERDSVTPTGGPYPRELRMPAPSSQDEDDIGESAHDRLGKALGVTAPAALLAAERLDFYFVGRGRRVAAVAAEYGDLQPGSGH